MDKKAQTIKSYNDNAQSFAKKFDALGSRADRGIKEAFALVNRLNPNVLEIGCGNGRDAEEIIKYTNDYLGIDISEKLIELARQKVPRARFEVADIERYTFPEKLDIIFAFASLIHASKEGLQRILKQLFGALNSGGVIYLSMKYGDVYDEVTKEDELGVRTHYLYSIEDIKELTQDFIVVKSALEDRGGRLWVEVMLQKK
ncbi:MAG: class I SAM-dependent methyltransferase [Candidatus Pacebacteria bacterium]|nr:class I SAM-dependent methyltransferase [Candidatus Paceibacterota bacterium]